MGIEKQIWDVVNLEVEIKLYERVFRNYCEIGQKKEAELMLTYLLLLYEYEASDK